MKEMRLATKLKFVWYIFHVKLHNIVYDLDKRFRDFFNAEERSDFKSFLVDSGYSYFWRHNKYKKPSPHIRLLRVLFNKDIEKDWEGWEDRPF